MANSPGITVGITVEFNRHPSQRGKMLAPPDGRSSDQPNDPTTEAVDMRYPDWFKAQVVQAVTLHGLSYSRASHLYDVTDETIRKWVNGTADASAGLDRMEALEHRVARIEHYLALAEGIRRQGQHECRHLHRVERGNGHNGFAALHDLSHATAAER